MSKFCSNCGIQIGDAVKFCAECGTKIPETPLEQPQVQQPAPPSAAPVQQSQYIQPPQQPSASANPKKKKGKLLLILGIVAVLVVGIIVGAVVLITSSVKTTLNNTAKADYYEIGKDQVPSVKLVLGEERKVTGISTSAKTGGVSTKEIKYQVAAEQNKDMLKYVTYLCERDSFAALTDGDFNKPEGGIELGRNSVDDGYMVQVHIKFDTSGYTVTLLRQAGEIKQKNTGTLDTASDPWVGLWRKEDGAGVELFYFRVDGVVIIEGRYTDGTADLSLVGDYAIKDGQVTLTDMILDGSILGEQTLDIEISGDTAVIDRETFRRVPAEEVETVLANLATPSATE